MVELLSAGTGLGYTLGYAAGALLIPGIGLALLITGIVTRYRRRPPASMPTGYPAQYPPAPGYPPAYAPGYPPYLPPAPPRTGGTVMIVLGAVILVVGLILVLAATASRTTSVSGITVGQCITSRSYQTRDMDPTPIDCSRTDAVYELASRGDGSAQCPDRKRDDSYYSAVTNDTSTLCYLMNLQEGHCYRLDKAAHSIDPTDCTDGGTIVKVVRRIDDSTDTTGCSSDDRAIAYPDPQRIYCVGRPN